MKGEEGEWKGRRESGRGGGRMGEEVGGWQRRRKGGGGMTRQQPLLQLLALPAGEV